MNWSYRNEKFSNGQTDEWYASFLLRRIHELIFTGAYCPEDLREPFGYPEEDKNNPELWEIWCQYYGGDSFLEFCDGEQSLARQFMEVTSVWMVIANALNERIMDVYELLEEMGKEKDKEIISPLRMIQLRFSGSGLLDIQGRSGIRDGQDRDIFQKVCEHSILDIDTILRFAEKMEPGGDVKKHPPLNIREQRVKDMISSASKNGNLIEHQEIMRIYYNNYLTSDYEEDEKKEKDLTSSELTEILRSLSRKVPYIEYMNSGSKGWKDIRYIKVSIEK